jgi:hypothetical protein
MGDKSRGLTKGEIDLAKGIFGNSIDYGSVRVHNGKIPGMIESRFQPDDVSVPFDANDIYMPPKVYSADMSKGDKGDFIHLMAYIWQYQNKVTTPEDVKNWGLANRNNLEQASEVKPDPKKDLKDYNAEQRARLIESLYHYRDNAANPQAPAPPDPDGSLFLKQYGPAIEKNPNGFLAKMMTANLGITKGSDGQLHVDPQKWAKAQASMKAQQAQDAQTQKDKMQVLARFIADPSYLKPNHAVSAPAKSRQPAPQS